MRQVSLWDVDDVDTFGPVVEMTVGAVEQIDVREFCRRWHYAVTGGNMTWNYGLYDGDVLVGIVSYNLPTRPACESVFGPEHHMHVGHMGRLVCAEDAPRNVESRLIAGSLKLLSEDVPILWAILTFAAQGQGHVGYVYQATNAIYAGESARSHYYIDERGQRRAPKQGKNLSIPKALARGWEVHHEPPKHRYVYILGTPAQRRERRKLLKLPSLPYPKAVAS